MLRLTFTDRYVTAKGTIYTSLIGDSEMTDKSIISSKEIELGSLRGQRVIINGKESNIINTEISVGRGWFKHNYYASVLTDEEFTGS